MVSIFKLGNFWFTVVLEDGLTTKNPVFSFGEDPTDNGKGIGIRYACSVQFQNQMLLFGGDSQPYQVIFALYVFDKYIILIFNLCLAH